MFWLVRLVAQVPPTIATVSAAVRKALDAGESPDRAEALARKLSDEMGDVLQVHVRGVDVVGPDAQADLFAFVARVTVRATRAAQG